MAAYSVSTATSNVEQQSVIETVWQSALSQLSRGASELVLTTKMCDLVGQQGIAAIADRFSSFIQARASVLHDPSVDAIRILPPPSQQPSPSAYSSPAAHNTLTASHSANAQVSLLGSSTVASSDLASPPAYGRGAGTAKSKLAKDRIAKVPRPPNAFILYRQHHHPIVKKQHSDIHNNQISIIIGNMWKNEGEATKQAYKTKAEEVKRKHFEAHPEYQYQPRKPSEKKRRMTKRKVAKLATSMSPASSSALNIAEVTQHGTSFLTNSSSSLASIATEVNQGQANNVVKNTHAAFEALYTPQYTLPETIPDFATFGSYLVHDFNAMEPGLFEAMIDKRNEHLLDVNAPLPDPLAPQILLSGLSEDATRDHLHNRTLYNLDALDAQFDARDAQIDAELNVDEARRNNLGRISSPYDSEEAYQAQADQRDVNLQDRMGALCFEFHGTFDPMLDVVANAYQELPILPQYEVPLTFDYTPDANALAMNADSDVLLGPNAYNYDPTKYFDISEW